MGSGKEHRAILLLWDCEDTPWRRSSRTGDEPSGPGYGRRAPLNPCPTRSPRPRPLAVLGIDRPVFSPCTHAVRAGLG